MPNDDLSFDSANSDRSKEFTASLESGAGIDSSTNPPQNSEKSLDSVKPKKTMKHLGYCESRRVEFSRENLIYCTFAPGLQFEWNYSRRYPWQPEPGSFHEFENCDFFQLRNDVKKIRDWNQANKEKDPEDPIIAACNDFLEMYNNREDMPSKEVYLASLQIEEKHSLSDAERLLAAAFSSSPDTSGGSATLDRESNHDTERVPMVVYSYKAETMIYTFLSIEMLREGFSTWGTNNNIAQRGFANSTRWSQLLGEPLGLLSCHSQKLARTKSGIAHISDPELIPLIIPSDLGRDMTGAAKATTSIITTLTIWHPAPTRTIYSPLSLSPRIMDGNLPPLTGSGTAAPSIVVNSSMEESQLTVGTNAWKDIYGNWHANRSYDTPTPSPVGSRAETTASKSESYVNSRGYESDDDIDLAADLKEAMTVEEAKAILEVSALPSDYKFVFALDPSNRKVYFVVKGQEKLFGPGEERSTLETRCNVTMRLEERPIRERALDRLIYDHMLGLEEDDWVHSENWDAYLQQHEEEREGYSPVSEADSSDDEAEYMCTDAGSQILVGDSMATLRPIQPRKRGRSTSQDAPRKKAPNETET
ncbi:hypothetical protein HD553DRAFT_324357 [Filobasidium floriforme]|uniref:uncharacterized protein n=1 Tax=Filobasidium floriforme TaxID=5210 RepID=UPI001E8D2FBC|nr:uncharacterized protein HD553DRAFT_324357 [Filobasidium floriforme]KAH8084251.1 hypothetical protein HD553DRAFT_324357 [Filobasidium floriforme]